MFSLSNRTQITNKKSFDKHGQFYIERLIFQAYTPTQTERSFMLDTIKNFIKNEKTPNLGLYRDQDILETNAEYLAKKNQHSLKPIWNEIAKMLLEADNRVNHTKKQKVFIVNAGSGYLIKHLKDQSFDNILGIDLQREAIEYFQKSCPSISTSASVQNFFRYKQTELANFDAFIISRTLEYVENVDAYLNQIPKGKRIIITFPNYDDGLVLQYFETTQSLENFFEKYLDISATRTINLFVNPEFMIDQKIFVLMGVKK